MNSRFVLLLIISLPSTQLAAQSPPASAEPELSTQSLFEQIKVLEKRITELEDHERKEAAGQSCAMLPQPAAVADRSSERPNSGAPPQALHEHEVSPAAREAEIHYPSLQIRGFGDIDFSATDQKGTTSGFNLGQFVLHFASPLSAKVSYFGEVSFTAEGSAANYVLALERNIIRYDYNDYFKISFGKYHTPISYWNTAFHHGAWLQTTVSRPQMIKFGGTDLPVHFVGLQAEGNIPSGGLGLAYSLGLGNGRSFPFSKAGDAGDVNDNRAWVANVYARPSRVYGLQFGGSFYRDKLTPVPGTNFDEWIASGHLVWSKQQPEFLAEYANVHHRDLQTNQTFNTTNYYVQVAYRLPWQENKWKPYYRFEYIHRPPFEPVWDYVAPTVSDLVGSLVGMRYDITTYAAFKGEYRSFREGVGEPRLNGAFFQTAFTF
ncbi:MAG TPA: hypothetical protein VJX67_20125 [Blastocatellia bacterium]|nr:hypothetical protein [Blastocatellia bacterium]